MADGGAIHETRDRRGKRVLTISNKEGIVETLERFSSAFVLAGMGGIRKTFKDGKQTGAFPTAKTRYLTKGILDFPSAQASALNL